MAVTALVVISRDLIRALINRSAPINPAVPTVDHDGNLIAKCIRHDELAEGVKDLSKLCATLDKKVTKILLILNGGKDDVET